MAGEATDFVLRALAPNDRTNKFDIAHIDDAHRNFLKLRAAKFDSSNIAKTYVAVEKDAPAPARIYSYITIRLSEIQREYAPLDDCPEANRFNSPAISIVRLATDRKYEGLGLGSALISLVAGIASKHVMPHVGCRFLVLEANRERIDFYRKRGFTLVNNQENAEKQNPVMFMDLHKIALAG